MPKKDIKNFTLEQLTDEISKLKEAPYRTRQIFLWLYKKGIDDLEKITNLPKPLIEKIKKYYYVGTIELSQHLRSSDKTEKFLFKLSDGNFIESVLICAKDRKTICISTQVGCKYSCSFCASGSRGFVRDLTPSEIMSQILFLQRNLKHRITNYVFMGMGEPLDNYENVVKAIMIMNEPQGLNIGARRITISTCGIIPAIERLKDLGLQINLSISLHATDDRLRSQLMPVNKSYPVEKLIKACENYIGKTGRMVTLEYILIKGINDSSADAEKLARIAKRLNAKVNLVPYSEIPKLDYKRVSEKDTDIFVDNLIKKGVKVTLRESKGKDINAACGQLAGRLYS